MLLVPALPGMVCHVINPDFLILAIQGDQAEDRRVVPEEPPVALGSARSLATKILRDGPVKAGVSYRSGSCCSVAAA